MAVRQAFTRSRLAVDDEKRWKQARDKKCSSTPSTHTSLVDDIRTEKKRNKNGEEHASSPTEHRDERVRHQSDASDWCRTVVQRIARKRFRLESNCASSNIARPSTALSIRTVCLTHMQLREKANKKRMIIRAHKSPISDLVNVAADFFCCERRAHAFTTAWPLRRSNCWHQRERLIQWVQQCLQRERT